MEAVTSFITEPMTINRFINARLKTRDSVLIGLGADIATGAVSRGKSTASFRYQNPDFEAKVAVGQGADGANVDNVRRQRIVERLFGK